MCENGIAGNLFKDFCWLTQTTIATNHAYSVCADKQLQML